MRRAIMVLGFIALVACGGPSPAATPDTGATVAAPFDVLPAGSRAATRAPIPAYDPGAWTFAGDSITDLGDYPEQVCARLGCRPRGRDRTVEWRPAILSTTMQRVPAPGPYTAYALLASFRQRVEAWPAGVLVVFAGVNDFYDAPALGYTLDSWRDAWVECYGDLAAMPWQPRRVIVVGLPAVSATYAGAARVVPYGMADMQAAREAQDRITKEEAQRRGATYVDLAGMTPAMLGPDGLHPNADGQRFIAGRVIAAGD